MSKNIKTEKDYPHYEIKYITVDVLQAFKMFFIIHGIDKSIDRLCNFIERNNLYITIEELMSISLGSTSVLIELTTLNHIKSILKNIQKPRIVKTPKMSTIYFDTAELLFEDDLLIEFKNIKHNAYTNISTMLYENDELKYCKSYTKYPFSSDICTTKYLYTQDDISYTCCVSESSHKFGIRSSYVKTYVKGTDIQLKDFDSTGTKFEFCKDNGLNAGPNRHKYMWNITETKHECWIIKDDASKELYYYITLENGNKTELNYPKTNECTKFCYRYNEGLYKYLECIHKICAAPHNFTYFNLKSAQY